MHGFSLVVEDTKGRTRQLPYAITVDNGPRGSFDSGCACVVPSANGNAALLLLGLLLFLRRRR